MAAPSDLQGQTSSQMAIRCTFMIAVLAQVQLAIEMESGHEVTTEEILSAAYVPEAFSKLL